MQLRVARPVTDVDKSARMYCAAFGLDELGRFENHQGFDGVMLGRPGCDHHFEFTVCKSHPVTPSPTHEDLIVFYLPDAEEWRSTCTAAVAAGFVRVKSFNPYWDVRGQTFEDADGYRIVLENAAFGAG